MITMYTGYIKFYTLSTLCLRYIKNLLTIKKKKKISILHFNHLFKKKIRSFGFIFFQEIYQYNHPIEINDIFISCILTVFLATANYKTSKKYEISMKNEPDIEILIYFENCFQILY